MSEEMYEVSRILSAFLTYILVVLRCGCLILFAPFFSSEVFSNQFRIYLALAFSLLFVESASLTSQVPRQMDMVQLFILAGQEFMVGMAIAYLGMLIFTGVQMAGEIAGQMIGFSMANVMDPQSGIEVPMLGFINLNVTLMLFITAKMHLILIYIMAKSYDYIGIGCMLPDVNFANPVLSMTLVQATALIRLGAQMAVPIMFIMLMNGIVEGFITKTMPQMHIQVLGMPLRVLIGVTVLVIMYPAICSMLLPYDWRFNLTDMPEGPLGQTMTDLSEMVKMMHVEEAP